jgi:hypothetical protein
MADYTREELMRALRSADAAGDTKAATAIARRLDAMRRPDFSNVQTTVRSRAKPKTAAQLTGVSDRALAPTAGMSPLARGIAGLGKSFSGTGRGIKQLGTQAGMVGLGLQAGLMNRLGLDGNELVRRYGLPMQDSLRAQEAEEADRRQVDAPLMATPAGMAGNVAGYAGQFLGPGAALRGTSIGRMLLPTTVRGNIALGAGTGFLQPATSDADRALNTGLGAGAGGLGAGIPAVAGAGVRRLRGPKASRPEKRAGRLIQEALQGRPMRVSGSAVPGVNLTLGDATLDPGIMALERQARRADAGTFTEIDLANNAARVGILQRLAGDDLAMDAAEQARAAKTRQARNTAFSEASRAESQAAQARQAAEAAQAEAARFRMFGLEPPEAPPLPQSGKTELSAQLSTLADRTAGRPTVQNTIKAVMSAIGDAPDTVAGLYNARQYITDLLEGKAGSDMQAARAATRELMQAKDMIDSEIQRRAPSWGQYLTTFQNESRPINKMQIGRELMDRATTPGVPTRPDASADAILSPAKFMQLTRNNRRLNALAAKATGFKKADIQKILSPDELSEIQGIYDDMRRITARQANRAQPGSPTFEAFDIAGDVARRGIGSAIGRAIPTGGIVEAIQKGLDLQTRQKLAFLIANPEAAQRVLSALEPAKREALEQALIAIGGQSTIATTN